MNAEQTSKNIFMYIYTDLFTLNTLANIITSIVKLRRNIRISVKLQIPKKERISNPKNCK